MVRVLVAALITIAVSASFLAAIPTDAEGRPNLPSVALGQSSIYRLEVGLAAFYGALLLVTPAFWGVIRGRLPTEISSRGAKFAEEVDQSVERTQEAIEFQRQKNLELEDKVALAKDDIKALRKALDDAGTFR